MGDLNNIPNIDTMQAGMSDEHNIKGLASTGPVEALNHLVHPNILPALTPQLGIFHDQNIGPIASPANFGIFSSAGKGTSIFGK